jgi:hypothetical protein
MKTLKFGLFVCVLTVVTTGCVSYGTSYEKHYHNDLANGQQVTCDANGTPQARINGGETYEHHYSYDLNPFVWVGCGLKFLFGGGHFDNEVVVNAPAMSCQQQQVQGVAEDSVSVGVAGNGAEYQGAGYQIFGYDTSGVAIYLNPSYPGWFWYRNNWSRQLPARYYRGGGNRGGSNGGGYPNRGYPGGYPSGGNHGGGNRGGGGGHH